MPDIQKKIKKVDLALDQAKAFDFLQTIINNTPLVIWALDADGIFTLSEGHGLIALGLKPGEVVGKSCFEVYKDFPQIIKASKSALSGQEVADTWQVGDNFYESRYTPIKNSAGKVTGAIGVSLDVTKQMQTRQEYQELVNNLPIGVYKNTPGYAGYFTDANTALIKIFEASSKEELLNHKVSDLYQDAAQRKKFSDKLMTNGVVEGEELALKTLKGKLIWGLVSAAVKKDSHGETYFYGTFQDISERKRMSEELTTNEKKFKSLFDSSAIGVFIADSEGKPMDVNAALQSMLGYSSDEFKKLSVKDVTFSEDYEKDLDLFKDLMAGKISHYQIEKRYLKKDGGLMWGRLTVSLIRDELGKAVFTVAMLEDIDKQKAAQDELSARFTELKQLNKLMIGRELKMMELKKEVDDLKKKLSQ